MSELLVALDCAMCASQAPPVLRCTFQSRQDKRTSCSNLARPTQVDIRRSCHWAPTDVSHDHLIQKGGKAGSPSA